MILLFLKITAPRIKLDLGKMYAIISFTPSKFYLKLYHLVKKIVLMLNALERGRVYKMCIFGYFGNRIPEIGNLQIPRYS